MCICMYTYIYEYAQKCLYIYIYGVATVSRIDKIIGFFCTTSSLL